MANDIFCWVCHKELVTGLQFSYCKTCPRAYHTRCVPNADVGINDLPVQPVSSGEHWACPECRTIDHAENVLYRWVLSTQCFVLPLYLCYFQVPSNAATHTRPILHTLEFPRYSEYVVNPMDLSQLERNVRRKQYGSTEAFLADTKWILHNSIIFNTCQAKLTSAARSILKACKQEMAEIENCPDCYLNAHTRKESWFIEVCRRPHMLVWAKLKGFPFWPAKAMKVNKEAAVDVRFFGAHDRAWVPLRDCYLYSPRLKERFGAFTHAPPRTPFDPDQQEKQLNMLLPNYRPGVDGKRARTILHPEISAISRTPPSKTTTPTSATSSASTKDSLPTTEKNSDKGDKNSPAVVVTTTRSGRLSTTPRGKSYANPVVIIKRQTEKQVVEPSVKVEEDVEMETEEVSEKQVSDNVSESSVSEDPSVNAEDDDNQKLAEEEAISAIIKASKAMEETLTQVGPSDNENGDESISDLEDPLGAAEEDEGPSDSKDPESDLEEPDAAPEESVPTNSPIPDSSTEIIAENNELEDICDQISTSPCPQTDAAEEEGAASGAEKVPVLESANEECDTSKNESTGDDGIKTAEAKVESPIEAAAKDEPEQKKEEKSNELGSNSQETDAKQSDLIVPKISIKLLKNSMEVSKSTNKLSISQGQIEVTPIRDKMRSVPALISADKRLDSALCEVQITPIPNLKRKLVAPPSKPPGTPQESSVSSEVSSDSEGDPKDASSAAKKKKLERSTKLSAVNDGEEPVDGEDAVNSPRPSDDDSIFPSLFLDPSVTITVVENSLDKKSSEAAAKELSASVKLSSDVSLTIIDKSKDKLQRAEVASPSPSISSTGEGSSGGKLLSGQHGKSKARKSIPQSTQSKSQLISVKKPSSLMANGTKTPPTEPPRLTTNAQKEMHMNSMPVSRASNMMPGGPGMQQQQQHHPHPPNPHHRPPHPHPPGHGPLPQLHPRPFTGHMPVGPPPEAGPATAELHKSAGKLTEYVRQSLEALLRDLSAVGSPQATIGAMQLEIEHLVMLEMRASMESERGRALAEVRRQAEIEKQRAIEETKKKQWCAYCNKEALFYCCWNTSYCDYPCQQAHWPRHMATCAQKYSKDGNGSNNSSPVSNISKSAYHNTTRTDAADRDLWMGQEDDEPSSKSASSKWAGKRKRCGQCEGCAVTQNCGVCAPCKNSRTHQVCRERRCRVLEESERQRWLASQTIAQASNKKTPQNKGLPPNVPLTQQHMVAMNSSGVMSGGRPPQHFAIVPRPMQGGGGMPQFAMYPAGGSPRPPLGSQTPHVAFPMQPHFFM
ncbi:hypothetical protein B566_EDAN014156 [Ephemera danica]|nr:hypothetical protein B566_EDAN014156 [Ephemera danica]